MTDMPADDATEPSAPAPRPARNSRSAQRRRAAVVMAPPSALVDAMEPDLVEVVPETEPSADVPALVEPSPPVVAADADPLPFTPPAAVMADTIVEDIVMDTVNTADTVASTANDVADQMADRGQAAFADVSGRAKDAMEKGSRMVEELGAFGKGNVEALVESSKIAAKGFETLGQEAAEFTRKSFESATAAMRTLAATRSPTEFMKLQSDYARSMFDAMVAETSKSTEMVMKLANDVAQPLSNRVAVAADKMKVAA